MHDHNIRPKTDREPEGFRLLFKPREAAKSLGISERTLYTLTKSGEIPAVRIRRAVRYSVDDLKAWIRRQSERNCETDENTA